jgi:ribosomal protein S18 acetylase RimI-like enzyme
MNLADANARNLTAALSGYGELERRSGVVLITAPVAYSVFNIALLDAAVPDVPGELKRRIRVARQHYESAGTPWSFWICESDLPRRELRRLFESFEEEGLQSIAESPGMDTRQLVEPRRRLPNLAFRQVEDEQTRRHFSRLVCASFHIPPAMADAVYSLDRFWAGPLKAWVGYEAGRPVTTTAAVDSSGVLGVYSVATMPDCRRKGYGEAAVRHAVARLLEQGAGGPVVLQSSPGAYSLYRSMGFRSRTRFYIFATTETAP